MNKHSISGQKGLSLVIPTNPVETAPSFFRENGFLFSGQRSVALSRAYQRLATSSYSASYCFAEALQLKSQAMARCTCASHAFGSS